MSGQSEKTSKSIFVKKRLIGIVVIILAVLIFVLLKMTRPEQPVIEVKQKVWPIETISITLDKLSPVITLYGTVESHSLVTAAAPVSGVMESVPVREGDEFDAGQLLAAIASTDLEIPLEVAKADVADTEAQLKLQDLNYQANLKRLQREKEVLKIKQDDVERNRELIRKKLVSKSALDQAKEALTRQEFAVVGAELSVEENKAKVAQLKARLEKARANLKQAEINQSRGVVVAPYAGRIADVHVSQGDRVSVNAAMLSYYATDSLQLRAEIPVSQMPMVYRALRANEQLYARLNVNGTSNTLPLVRLDGQASASGVDAFFDMTAALSFFRPGDLLKIQLLGQPIANSFAVPYSAVYGSNRIYSVENGELKSIQVELVGDTLIDGNPWALVKGDVPDGSVIATTHLPNAISGLKVSPMDAQ